MNINVIYEDDDIVAINKPSGLLVHPVLESSRGDTVQSSPTLVNWLLEKYPEIKLVGDDPSIRPGIVHRLDKDTSGVLVAAKNQKSFDFLKSQFQNRQVVKKYIALVHGKVKNKEGVINFPIGASKHDFRKKSSIGKLRGKIREAVTEYKVIEEFPDYTILEISPQTGRTHQIRVHLKSIGHPIAGDKLYGQKKETNHLNLERQFLHAKSIDIMLPSGGKIRLEADLPDDLKEALLKLQKA